MRSLTKEVTAALREIKEASAIVGVSAWPSTGPTTVYPFDGSGKRVYRDYYVVGGKRYDDRVVTVRHHEDGTFSVHQGRGGRDGEVGPAADLRDAVRIATAHVTNGGGA